MYWGSSHQELLAVYYYYYDKIDILAIEDKMKRRCCKDMEQWLSVFYQEIVLMKNAIGLTTIRVNFLGEE